jgi:hypothetical protein
VRRFSKRHFEKDADWKVGAPGNEHQLPDAPPPEFFFIRTAECAKIMQTAFSGGW